MLEGREVGRPLHDAELCSGDAGGKVPTALLEVDHVEISHHHEDGAPHLGQTRPGVRGIRFVARTLGMQGDPVHFEGQLPKRATDPAFWSMGAVDPEPDLAEVERVECAGGVGRLQGVPDGGLDGVNVGVSDLRGTRDGRGNKDQRGDPLGMGQSEIKRDLAAHRVADEHDRPQGDGVDHGEQIDPLVMLLRLVGRRSEAAPVVGHHVHVRAEQVHYAVPAATVRDSGVEEHHLGSAPGAMAHDGKAGPPDRDFEELWLLRSRRRHRARVAVRPSVWPVWTRGVRHLRSLGGAEPT